MPPVTADVVLLLSTAVNSENSGAEFAAFVRIVAVFDEVPIRVEPLLVARTKVAVTDLSSNIYFCIASFVSFERVIILCAVPVDHDILSTLAIGTPRICIVS